jgi:hypothetical protein
MCWPKIKKCRNFLSRLRLRGIFSHQFNQKRRARARQKKPMGISSSVRKFVSSACGLYVIARNQRDDSWRRCINPTQRKRPDSSRHRTLSLVHRRRLSKPSRRILIVSQITTGVKKHGHCPTHSRLRRWFADLRWARLSWSRFRTSIISRQPSMAYVERGAWVTQLRIAKSVSIQRSGPQCDFARVHAGTFEERKLDSWTRKTLKSPRSPMSPTSSQLSRKYN